ncbi:DUF4838 domain-containing protein [Niameybacter massiliensis]|uniref:DUF4838 domain-containing protein n=1 Tax=Niameybacter massiliensis TaxID=1658108 RepID=UPI0006B48D08|nr:DUF4838 domain-containing protein [Niameybacter massiliensis]
MDFNFAKNNQVLCSIHPTDTSYRSATILADYLKKITHLNFSLDSNEKLSHQVIFKTSNAYGHNGFAYYTVQSTDHTELIFEAENEQAFVYAIYDFLERLVGCRYFTPDIDFIPTCPNLSVELNHYSYIPPIEYREIYYKAFENKAFAEKHKAAQSKVHEGWGFWCHSFQELLPSKEYFEAHPEYFALLNGERHPQGEPCLSNPEVQKIMIENLKKFMDEKPDCLYWSVSQNDDNNYCQCEHCKKLDDYDESPMGSVLNFVNKVANSYPDKVISTLSYWYTRKPPKHTRPAKNVHIMTCNIEANRGLPIAIDPTSKESKEELEFWASISENVSLWDYNIQFRNLVSPFPNLRTLAPNMQFFVKNNVKLLFSQCNREIGGEWSDLRGYLLAKLAWDPYCDINMHLEDFCKGYYQEGAPFILEYIKTIHDAQEKHNHRLDIFGNPEDAKKTFLTKKLFKYYVELFDKAKASVAYDEDLLLRVQVAALPIDYAGIYLKYGTSKQQLERIARFAKVARKCQLHMVEEWKITVDQFVTDALSQLDL